MRILKLMTQSRNALALSGGGEAGAVQVGYANYFKDKGISFNRIIGTSTGALQGVMIAQGKIKELNDVWLSIRGRKDIYQNWTFGWIEGFFRGGLYNPKGLKSILKRYVDIELLMRPETEFMACSALARQPFTKTYAGLTGGNVLEAIYSSAAFPIVFPPGKILDDRYTDGGLNTPIPAEEAAKDCHTLVVGLASPLEFSKEKKPYPKTLFGYGINFLDGMFSEIYRNDLKVGLEKYWAGNHITVLQPTPEQYEQYSPGPMKFDPKYIRRGIEIGYEIARIAFENKKESDPMPHIDKSSLTTSREYAG